MYLSFRNIYLKQLRALRSKVLSSETALTQLIDDNLHFIVKRSPNACAQTSFRVRNFTYIRNPFVTIVLRRGTVHPDFIDEKRRSNEICMKNGSILLSAKQRALLCDSYSFFLFFYFFLLRELLLRFEFSCLI